MYEISVENDRTTDIHIKKKKIINKTDIINII